MSFREHKTKNKFYEVSGWHMQSPRKFREELWSWLSDSSRGGELGQVVGEIYQCGLIHNRILKPIMSKTGRGVAIVLVLTSIGFLIKREAQTPWYETIFDNLESISLSSAGIIFLLEIKDRQKRDQYEAWQVINSAMGQTGSGGRIQALEDLHKDCVDLEGVAAPEADLSGIDLRKANLERANFSGAQFDGAKLQGATLRYANLQEANLFGADLQGVNLENANLQKADLRYAKLKGANLAYAKLQYASLWGADLQEANLMEAQLQDSKLIDANLQGANFFGADLTMCLVIQKQLDKAKLCCTKLPGHITMNSNRDCKAIGINPEKPYILKISTAPGNGSKDKLES